MFEIVRIHFEHFFVIAKRDRLQEKEDDSFRGNCLKTAQSDASACPELRITQAGLIRALKLNLFEL